MPITGDIKTVRINTSSSGDTTLVSAVATQRFQIKGLFVRAGGAVTVNIKIGSNNLIGPSALVANGGDILPLAPDGMFWAEGALNEAIIINLSGDVAVGGVLVYQIER